MRPHGVFEWLVAFFAVVFIVFALFLLGVAGYMVTDCAMHADSRFC